MNQILGFIATWGAVLRDSLPIPVQRILGLGRRFVVLEPGDGEWTLYQARGAALDKCDPVNPARLADQIRGMDGPIVLVLPETVAIQSDLMLPGTAHRSLEQVLEVEIERLTPFKAADVAVARQIHPTRDGQIRVNLTIVPHARIEEHVAPLRAAGIAIDHIIVDRARVDQAPELSLIAGPGGPTNRQVGWIQAVVTAALLFGAVISPFAVQEQRLRAYQTKLEELQPKVAAVTRLARELKALEVRWESTEAFSRSRVSMTALLEETTRALPDDTWLVRYQYEDARLMLEGRSSSATALVDLLNASRWLGDVRFRAPVTRDPATGADRFRLSAAVSRQ